MKDKKEYGFFYRNGLSLVFILFAVFSLAGQIYTGWHEHNESLQQLGAHPVGLPIYLQSGHFLQATFENWESEFLQMALFVILTIFLRQQGSSESKKLDEEMEPSEELAARHDSPWPVKKGGLILLIYKHSLSVALLLLFFISFVIHWYGSWKDFNEEQLLRHEAGKGFLAYLSDSRFWFESFQNWQSEFLSVFAIIFLSIYLRQIGSSQSKPVNASHDHTGES